MPYGRRNTIQQQDDVAFFAKAIFRTRSVIENAEDADNGRDRSISERFIVEADVAAVMGVRARCRLRRRRQSPGKTATSLQAFSGCRS